MITLRPGAERGRTLLKWLDSRHTFSFGEYHDPRQMGFRTLRVLNDDRVAPGGGFATHGHRDMEILSYALSGTLEHKDDLGNGSAIRPGEIQFMRAGTGVLHSEYNPSQTEPAHFLQIWILPAERGLPPTYSQHAFDREAARVGFVLLASGDRGEGGIRLQQDVSVYVTMPAPGTPCTLPLAAGRHAWVHVARGMAVVNGQALGAGDGAALSAEPHLVVAGQADAEVLVFDLA
mgnify:CR=1 FL=1